MSLALMLSLVVVTQSAEVVVVESRRSGLARKPAHTAVETVTAELVKNGVKATSILENEPGCKGKKPCLLAMGKRAQALVVVTLEMVNVLGEVSMRIEALSIEEEGRRVGVADYAGPLNKTEQIGEAVRTLLPGLEELVAVAKKPAPVAVVAPPVADAPKKEEPRLLPTPPKEEPLVVAPPVEKPQKKRVFTWVAAGLAAVAGGTGAAFGVMNLETQKKLRSADDKGGQDHAALTKQLNEQASVANPLMIGAGVAGVAAVILFFVEGN